MARETFFCRSSKAPAQPTKKSHSKSPPSAARGMARSSHHSARRFEPMPQGLPWVSMFLKTRAASSGKADSTSTWWRRRSTRRGHVLDEHRAGGLAPAAGGAGPDGGLRRARSPPPRAASRRRRRGPRRRGRGRRPTSVRRLVLDVVAQRPVHLLVAERLAGDVGRAVGLAAAALGAAVDVEGLLPGEVLHRARAEVGAPPTPGRACASAPRGGQPLQVDVGQRGDDVEVLPEGQEVEEDQHDDEVEPEGAAPTAAVAPGRGRQERRAERAGRRSRPSAGRGEPLRPRRGCSVTIRPTMKPRISVPSQRR